MEQKPSIGRIVHYTLETGDVVAAIINRVDVISETENSIFNVGLTVFLHNGGLISVKSDFSTQSQPGRWNWPPRI